MITSLDLIQITARLDAFGEWFERVIDGASYDRGAALEDWRLLDADQRRLIEHARARGYDGGMEARPEVIADSRFGSRRVRKQFTVRIDEELAETVRACAESKGLRLTDAIDAGLLLWLREQGVNGPSTQEPGPEPH